jgi:aspartate aminotransferase
MKSLMKKSNQKEKTSKIAPEINYSAIRKAFASGKESGVVNATIGLPDFDTPSSLKNAAKKAIDNGFNKYTETKGILPLREAIVKKIKKDYRINKKTDEVIITAGTTMGIYLTLQSIINEGDEIIIIEPYFVAYKEIIKILGGKPVVVKSYENFQLDISDLKKKITKKTKAIIINSPNNPSGVVYDKKTIREIVSIVKKDNIYLISDEIYRDIIYEKKFFSPLSIYKNTILINGFSKSHAITGWRIGYVVAPQYIIDTIEKLQQFTSVCPPSAFQYASVKATEESISPTIINRYKKSRDLIYEVVKNKMIVEKPEGAFYFFLKTSSKAEISVKKLLDLGIDVVPGEIFGDSYKNYIRFSYALPEKDIKKIVEALKKFMGK